MQRWKVQRSLFHFLTITLIRSQGLYESRYSSSSSIPTEIMSLPNDNSVKAESPADSTSNLANCAVSSNPPPNPKRQSAGSCRSVGDDSSPNKNFPGLTGVPSSAHRICRPVSKEIMFPNTPRAVCTPLSSTPLPQTATLSTNEDDYKASKMDSSKSHTTAESHNGNQQQCLDDYSSTLTQSDVLTSEDVTQCPTDSVDTGASGPPSLDLQSDSDVILHQSEPECKKPRIAQRKSESHISGFPCSAIRVNKPHCKSTSKSLPLSVRAYSTKGEDISKEESSTVSDKMETDCDGHVPEEVVDANPDCEVNIDTVVSESPQETLASGDDSIHVRKPEPSDMCTSDLGSFLQPQPEQGLSSNDDTQESDSISVCQELPFYSESDSSDIFNRPSDVKMVTESCDVGETGERVVSDSKKKRKSHKRSTKPAPNAFVSVRIPSTEIQERMEEVQQKILGCDKNLKWTLVPLVKSHLTLMVLRLKTEDEIERAKEALVEAARRVESSLLLEKDPLVLSFSGVGNFRKDVVFGKLLEGPSAERLASMAEIVRSVFQEHQLASTDDRKFVPHLTIAKVNKKARKKGIKGIALQSYSDLLSTEFGSQEIQGLELLSMTLPETGDGYYHCFHQCMFNNFS